MLDSMMQDSIDQTLDDRQARPVAAPKPQAGFSVWNTIKAPAVGIGAGAVESGGFAADVLGAFGQVQAGYGAQADPSLLFSAEEQRARREAGADAREQVRTGEAFSTEIGTGLRATARSMIPDPATSNAVENVLFGLGRFGGKAVGYSLMAGPVAGAALTGADEAMTAADRLAAEGVDPATRTRVAIGEGVAAAAGVSLPIAGRTAISTAALVAAGGPGAFIAQQAASRAILQNAGYDKIADQYDPFDPVGLAVSTLVPAGFGAVALRGARRGAQAPADPAAARELGQMAAAERKAMRYNDPRLDAYAVTAAQREGLPPDLLLALKNAGEKSNPTQVSPKGAAGVAQLMPENQRKYGVTDPADPIQSIDGMARYLRDTMRQYDGNIRAVIADYNGGPRQARAVLEGREPPATETARYLRRVEDYLAERTGEAAGRAEANDPEAVAAARVALVRETVESWNLKDPADIAAAQDHLTAIVRASDQLGAGQRVDVSGTVNWDTLQNARMLDDMVGRLEAARAELLPEAGMVAEPGAVRTIRQELEQLRRQVPDTSEDAIKARAKELQGDRVSYKQALSAARKEMAALADEHAGRIERLEQQLETNRGAERVRQQVQDIDSQISSVRAARASLDAPPSPVKATALAARQATTEPAGKGPARQAETGEAAAGIPPLKEAPGGAATAAEPPAGQSGAQSAAATVDAQAAEIARVAPDMMVQLDGMDAPVRLADALEAVRREADAEAADAPLLQVAAECFLRSA